MPTKMLISRQDCLYIKCGLGMLPASILPTFYSHIYLPAYQETFLEAFLPTIWGIKEMTVLPLANWWQKCLQNLVGRQDFLQKMLAISGCRQGLPTFYVDDPACLFYNGNRSCLPAFEGISASSSRGVDIYHTYWSLRIIIDIYIYNLHG